MVRTRTSVEDIGAEATPSAAAENQLLRQQLRDLTQQMATLTEHVHNIGQHSVPVGAIPLPPRGPSVPTTGATSGDGDATAAPPPFVAVGVPGLATTTTGETVLPQSERERKRANLARFMKYNPPIFEGETTDPWDVEKWVDSMEKLFEDLMMDDDERVPLAVHFLEGNARMWWKTVRPDPSQNAALPTWASFREKLFGAFFSRSVKKQLEDDLKHIQQGSRTVMEYQREFVKLVNCVPFVIRDEAHKAQLFVDGLRSNIFEVVQAADLHTFQQVVDRATIVERSFAITRGRREEREQERDRKRSQPSTGGGSSSRSRPPKYQKSQQKNRNTTAGGQKQWNKSCIICSGSHPVTACPKRDNHCYRCGKQGHIRYNCPLNTGVTTPAVTATSEPPHGKGGNSSASTTTPSQATRREGDARPPTGGRVYSMHQPGDRPREDVVAGYTLISNHQARTLLILVHLIPLFHKTLQISIVLREPPFLG